MRPASPQQAQAIALDHPRVVARVSVWRGQWVDLSEWLAGRWVVGIEVTATEDQPCARATVTLVREQEVGSLSPLVGSDPLLRLGQFVRIQVDVESSGEVEVFRGTVEDIAFGGDQSEIRLECIDLVGLLLDATIKDERRYGVFVQDDDGELVPGSVAASLTSTLQNLYRDNRPSGGLDLVVTGASGRTTVPYEQQIDQLYNALESLLTPEGLDLRQKHRASAGGWHYRIEDSQAVTGNTTPVLTLTPDDYYEISDISLTSVGVVDEVVVMFEVDEGGRVTDAEGRPRVLRTTGSITARTPQPVSERGYRSRIVDLRGSSQIKSEDDAQRAGDNAVAGLGRSPLMKQVVGRFDWRIELGDWIRCEPNGVHYTSAVEGAVVSVSLVVSGSECYTTFGLRGAYLGTIRGWRRRVWTEVLPPEDDDQDDTADPPTPSDGVFWYYTQPGAARGWSQPSSARESLGGYISTTGVSSGVGGLFPDIPEEGGQTHHRSVALLNVSGCPVDPTRAFLALSTYDQFSDTNDGMGVTWSFAFDPQGPRPYDSVPRQGSVSADGNTQPSPPLTWRTTFDVDDPFVGPRLNNLECIIVHIRLQVAANPIPRFTQDALRVRQCFPPSS